jgi:hypothetical protein
LSGETQQRPSVIFAVRTTSGQERTATELIASKVGIKKAPVFCIIAPELIK